ncbi:MAG: hypothetical protein AB7J25_25385, partial [Pseudonocardia sp.]
MGTGSPTRPACGRRGCGPADRRTGGPAALLCGPTAAFWHGLLARAPLAAEITVPRGDHRRAQRGVQLRRRDLDQRDRARRRGVTLTGRGLTVLETAIALPDGSALLDRALQRHVSPAELQAAFSRNPGPRGSPGQRRLLAAAGDRADSAAERLLVAILREAGVTGWVLGHP